MPVFMTISRSEANDAIRKHYGLPSSVEVRIVEDEAPNDQWINVPIDWKHHFPTNAATQFSYIEVMYRDGGTDYGHPTDWSYAWAQDDYRSDIIKFRQA